MKRLLCMVAVLVRLATGCGDEHSQGDLAYVGAANGSSGDRPVDETSADATEEAPDVSLIDADDDVVLPVDGDVGDDDVAELDRGDAAEDQGDLPPITDRPEVPDVRVDGSADADASVPDVTPDRPDVTDAGEDAPDAPSDRAPPTDVTDMGPDGSDADASVPDVTPDRPDVTDVGEDASSDVPDATPMGCLSAGDCDDRNLCTRDICASNRCMNPPIEAGMTCPTGVCNGAGACVECVDNTRCATTHRCESNRCVVNHPGMDVVLLRSTIHVRMRLVTPSGSSFVVVTPLGGPRGDWWRDDACIGGVRIEGGVRLCRVDFAALLPSGVILATQYRLQVLQLDSSFRESCGDLSCGGCFAGGVNGCLDRQCVDPMATRPGQNYLDDIPEDYGDPTRGRHVGNNFTPLGGRALCSRT